VNRPRTRRLCVHVTTVHDGRDVRIFRKEARTLAAAGFAVAIIHPGDVIDDQSDVQFVGLGLRGGRLRRAVVGGWRAFWRARSLGAHLFHFHDPELIPWGIVWRLTGGVTVYDVHEDVPKAVLRKRWIPAWARPSVAKCMRVLEQSAGAMCSAIVTATEPIARRFPGSRTIVVRNYPENLEQFQRASLPWSDRENAAMYAGTLSGDRGLHRMLDAIQRVDGRLGAFLWLAGPLRGQALVDSDGRELAPTLLRFEGQVRRERVVEITGRVRVGLHVVEPLEAYQESLPIKIFEYMAAGIPCVVSDFSVWRSLVETHGCGVVVDPMSPDAIAEAISWVLREPAAAEAMGRRGAAAAMQHYDWKLEGARLVELYGHLLET